MWPFVFAIVLVGLPTLFGSFMVVRGRSRKDINGGATIIVYAIVVGFIYAYLLPQGAFISADHGINMPLVFAVALVVGVVAGLVARRHDRNE